MWVNALLIIGMVAISVIPLGIFLNICFGTWNSKDKDNEHNE